MAGARVDGPTSMASILRELAQISHDRVRGARPLARAAASAIARGVRSEAGRPAGISAGDLSSLASALRRTQPAMASFRQWGDEVARIPRAGTAADRAARLSLWAIRHGRRLEQELPRLRRTARRCCPPKARLVTLSRSETVREALASLSAPRRPREIVVLESRPGGEGRGFARDFRARGLRARWVPDARGPDALRTADALVVGADTIYRDGTVLHKVGTRRMARLARRQGLPVYVIAGSSKALDRLPPRRSEGRLFDRTPVRLITEFWTDQGPVAPSDWPSRVGGSISGANRRPRGHAGHPLGSPWAPPRR